MLYDRKFYHKSPTGVKGVGILQFAKEVSGWGVSMHYYEKSEFGFESLLLTDIANPHAP